MILAETPAASGLRHPGGGEPYLSEFEPLLTAGGGVRGYDPRFALDHYMLDADVADPAQQAYVADLIDTARGRNETPVLACCRTLGRIGWLRRRFGGFHIVLIRDPVQQWMSFHSLRKRPRPTYFELCQYVILAELPDHQDAAETLLGLRLQSGGNLMERIATARRHLKRAPDAVSFAAFMAVYVASYLRALPLADLVIDIDRLARDPDYARNVETAIRAGSGLSPDFSGCRTPPPHVCAARVLYRAVARKAIAALGVQAQITAPENRDLHVKLSEALQSLPLEAQPGLMARIANWWEGLERPGRNPAPNRV